MKCIILLLITFVLGIECFGQAEKIVKKSREFSINLRETSKENKSMPDEQLNVFAKYSSKTQEIAVTLKNVNNHDSGNLILDYPLDFSAFTKKFDTAFLSACNKNDYYVEHGSHLEVFYWIISVSEELNNEPIAGKMIFAQYVQLSKGEETENYTQRAINLANALNLLNQKKAILDYNQIALEKIDKQLNDTFPQVDSDSLIKLKDSLNGSLKIAKVNFHEQVKNIEKKQIYKISQIQMQFEQGFLERIQVSIESPNTNRTEIFENDYPIGFSSINNFTSFPSTRLYRRSGRYEPWDEKEYIYLSDVIESYDNKLDLLTKDYSPSDTTISISPSNTPIAKLKKLKSVYIIDGKTFTDVNGFSEFSPNGLVQIELSRKFNLLTSRHQLKGSNNYGYLTYVNTQVNFSKIEDKLKGLVLRNENIIENENIVSPNYATNLDYRRYEDLGLNIDLNLFIYDAPDYKHTLYFDIGVHYGHTPIIDSNYQVSNDLKVPGEVNRLDAHNFTLFPKVTFQLFAERRYGLSASYQFNKTILFSNNRFKQVLSYSGKGLDLTSVNTNRSASYSHTLEAAMFFDTNPETQTGKIFAVARFHFQQRDINTFYPQILLGYAFNIFK